MLPSASLDRVYVIAHGWHTDLAIPSSMLSGRLRFFRQVYPNAKVLVFGFGKRTFMMAPVTTLSDLIAGPLPGAGTVLVTGLSTSPDIAYPDGIMASLALLPGGAANLSDFIWRSLLTRQEVPIPIGPGFSPGSIFFQSRIGYSGFNTCNRWAIDALRASGFTLPDRGVVFSSQVLNRVTSIAVEVCSVHDNP